MTQFWVFTVNQFVDHSHLGTSGLREVGTYHVAQDAVFVPPQGLAPLRLRDVRASHVAQSPVLDLEQTHAFGHVTTSPTRSTR